MTTNRSDKDLLEGVTPGSWTMLQTPPKPTGASSEQLMALEYGPLRHVKPDFHVWPSWMYLDHGPLPHRSRSDHRAEDGSIVSVGTAGLISRQGGYLTHLLEDGRKVILDGSEWVIDGAPVLDCRSCPELALCA